MREPYREAPSPPDPIDRLEQAMAAAGLDAAGLRSEIELEERALVAESLAAARAEPRAGDEPRVRGRVRVSVVDAPSEAKRLAPALADGISQCMRDDPSVFVWGEDVSIGVMGPTRGLADEFGPDRVIDCPISEAAFVGAAMGAAVGGLRPVVDIMFSSFAYVAFDQLVNQAGRLRYMTGGQVAVPLVVIGSAGAAGSNAAQHSEVPLGALPPRRRAPRGLPVDAAPSLLAHAAADRERRSGHRPPPSGARERRGAEIVAEPLASRGRRRSMPSGATSRSFATA